jgi:hypothetical protein
MGTNIEAILSYENLTSVGAKVLGGVPDDLLPAGFFRVERQIRGTSGFFRQFENSRQVAQINTGSASKAQEMFGMDQTPFHCLRVFNSILFDQDQLGQIQQPDNIQVDEHGEREIARQLAERFREVLNLRISSVYSALTKGALYFDSDGQLQTSSSGAAITVNYNIPAGNKTQLDVFGDGDIIAADWDEAGTDIPAHVMALKAASRKLSGYKTDMAFYGSSLPSWFLKNTLLKEMYPSSTGIPASLASGMIPSGFMGIKRWVPLNEAFFVTNQQSSATYNEWMADDIVVFTPDIEQDGWYGWVEGSKSVPTNLDIQTGNYTGGLRTAFGPFAYGHNSADPVGVKVLYGDTFLPIIKVPNAVFIADVKAS